MRIYFDENYSPHLVEGMRAFQEGRKSEGVVVTSIRAEFGQATADEDWIPQVASRHGTAITQDLNIHRTRAQWELCMANKLGIFFIKPPKQGWGYWQIVQLIVRMWPEFMQVGRETTKPFGYVIEATRPKLKRL